MKKVLVILALAAVMAVAVPGAVAADGVSFDVELQPGWNMVSVPLYPDNPSAAVVFADAEAVYWWNPVTKSYVYNPDIVPGRGYWVASLSAQTITVSGEPYTG